MLVSTLSVGNATFNLAAGAAGFTVTRGGDLTPAVDVGYTVTDGTAITGTNYTSTAPDRDPGFHLGSDDGHDPADDSVEQFSSTQPDVHTVNLTGVVATFGPPATFASQQSFGAGSVPFSVVVADVNGDGRPRHHRYQQ